jgi:carbamoyl-phosphate synthase large subunit
MLRVVFQNEVELIIQEKCRGEEFSFDMLYDLEGQLVRVFCKKKIQMRAGETDQAETINNAGMIHLGEFIGNKFTNIGPLDIDFFVDENGDYQLLEFNPRFGGGYPISHFVGANFPHLMLEIARGNKVEYSHINYPSNVIMMKEYGFIFKN